MNEDEERVPQDPTEPVVAHEEEQQQPQKVSKSEKINHT